MSWTYSKGSYNNLPIGVNTNNKSIRMDGVNDELTVGNSSFYNIGSGEFTFIVRLMVVDYNGPSVTSIFRKATTLVQRYLFNFPASDAGVGTFALVNSSNNSDSFRLKSSDLPLGQMLTVLIQRKGSNSSASTDAFNYPNSIRNPNNYKAYINGVYVPWDSVSLYSTDGAIVNVDNTENFILGYFPGAYYPVYFDLFAMYNRALTESEINNFTDTGALPSANAKGIWTFNTSLADSSSVNNSFQLYNNTLGNDYLYPRTNSILFAPKSTTTTKIFTAPIALTINAVVRFWGATTVSYSLDNVTFTTLSFSSDKATMSLAVLEGGIVYFKIVTNTKNGSIQVNY